MHPRRVKPTRRVHIFLMDAAMWDERYSKADLVWSAGPNAFVEQMCADLPPGRAVDLAAGEGRNALWLAERGWRAHAVDFSAVGLERARTIAAQRLGDNAERLTTEVADLSTWEPPEGGFDLVVVAYLQVPAHLRTPMLAAAARAVAPGGRLLVIAHHPANIERGVGGPPDPDVNYTQDDVLADIDGSGLVIDRAEEVTRAVATPDGERHAIDTLVWAHRT